MRFLREKPRSQQRSHDAPLGASLDHHTDRRAVLLPDASRMPTSTTLHNHAG
jgi:hypothetical protein